MGRLRLAVLAAGVLGCSGAGIHPPVIEPVSRSGPQLAEEVIASRQSLYRLSYDGGEGRVGLRVVLREALGERFQLTASDLAGRTVWGLDHRRDRVVLVDHRERRYCVTDPGFALDDLHPKELPLMALPRVLAGQLPVPAPADAQEEWTDAAGGRWRATYDDDEISGWLLSDDKGPAVWWTRQRNGGILSRRGGEQYRWTLIVSEEIRQALRDPVPAGFEEGVCDG